MLRVIIVQRLIRQNDLIDVAKNHQACLDQVVQLALQVMSKASDQPARDMTCLKC